MSKKLKILALFLLGAWLALKYVLPLAMPFLLGATLAVVAEPGVRFMQSKLHLRRSAASVASLGLSLSRRDGQLDLASLRILVVQDAGQIGRAFHIRAFAVAP